ncbi:MULTISPECIES: hypothetical protein [Bacteroidales]|jgi:hypothetical protein|uniref:hypothetical protein n=1 Tax=Bacteroidales TaxID=171549 RepID=UPI00057481BA|nr:hypothetical protein [Gabonia massiliensis]KHM47285.1 hypothetical protein PU94_07840 [Coprobacter secundus]
MKKYILIATIVLLILAIVLFPILVSFLYGTRPSVTEFWLQYTSILLSSTSFIAVIYTIWQQNRASISHEEEIKTNFKFARQNYDAQILNVIERFNSDTIVRCRKSCDILVSKLQNKQIDEELTRILKCEACGYLNLEKEMDQLVNTETYKYYLDFMQITRLFSLLSNYNYNYVTANALRYDYYYYRWLFGHIHLKYQNILKDLSPDKIKDHGNYLYTEWEYIIARFDKIMSVNRRLPECNGELKP